MSKTNLSADQLWDIDRYLLGDDTLDREAFESQMLRDETLALAVADELQRLQVLSMAVASNLVEAGDLVQAGDRALPAALHASRSRAQVMPWVVLFVAASLLWALFVWPGREQPADEQLADAAPMQEIAQEWLAIENAIDDPAIVELVSDAEFTALDSGDGHADLAGDVSGDDWMVVACEFLRDADI